MFGSAKQYLLALALLAVLAAGEARRHEESAGELRPHRHRHRHEVSAPRWSKRDDSEEYADEGRAPDYDEYPDDSEYPDEEEEEEEYAERRPLAPRRPGQHRRSEPRYQPTRYRHRGARTGRAHEAHSHHRPRAGAHRKRYEDEAYDEPDDERFENEPAGYRYPKYGPRKRPTGRAPEPAARRSTYEARRHRLEEEEDDYAYDADDEDYEEEEEEDRDRGNRSRKHSSRKSRFQQELPEDKPMSPRRSSSSKLNEWLKITRQNSHRRRPSRPERDGESNLWKDGDEDAETDLDNDFYKNDAAVTFDDIIRRLTEERSTSTTSRPTAKRNSKAASRSNSFAAYADLQSAETRRDSWPTQRSLDVDESKRKSLEEPEDNAGEGGEDEVDTKDDNTDYVDDENDERTTATTTTTTTTTTQRPVVVSNRFKSKQSRNYEAITTGSEYNGYQAKNNYPPMSEHSAYKWQYLGTAEGVKKARISSSQFSRNNKYLAAERDAAHNNAVHVAREGSCQWPRAKVMQVRDVYPNLTGTYTPRCVILHRCSDDTGCCSSETLTCEAKRTQQVELYFYVLHTISDKSEIEKLTFVNHTECECGERKDNGAVIDRQLELRNARHSYYSPPQNIVRSKNVCRCPTLFNASQVDGVCECTCSEQSKACKDFLQGKVILAMNDRNCIEKEQPPCTAPKCAFGEYDVRRGVCPRKKSMFATKWPSSFRRGS